MAGWDGGAVVKGLRARWRRLGIGGLALALLALMLPAFADTPQTGADPTVTLTVTPSTGLADGQVVTVTGTGFPASTAGTIRACGGNVAVPQCDLSTTTSFVTTAAGTIPPTAVTVKRIVNTGSTTFNCGVQACALVATAGAKSSQHQFRMAGAGTVLTTSSTTMSPTSSSTTTSSTTTSTVLSSTTTSTGPAANTSTSLQVTTSTVPGTNCANLRWTQGEAIAAIDSLIAAYPLYRDVGLEARELTNAKFAQTLASAGC